MDQTTLFTPGSNRIASRVAAYWPMKLFGITGFIVVFFIAYFLLLRFPVFPVTLMPVTWLDRAIPFHPSALPVYFSLWIYVSLPPSLLRNRRELIAHGLGAMLMGVMGLSIFFFWPTAVGPATTLGTTDMEAIAWLKQVDAAGNACPSLHVAFAVYAGLWLDRVLRDMQAVRAIRVINVCWCSAIAYSTLATKQHVLVDVLAGAILGWIAGSFRGKTLPQPTVLPAGSTN